MQERRKPYSSRRELQVERMRSLYSQIGEPLPVDVIIDLHRHLDAAIDMAKGSEAALYKRKNRKRQAN